MADPPGIRNDLSALPTGLRAMAGIEFDIQGIVQLSCSHPEVGVSFPTAACDIAVARECDGLHFLHACGWYLNGGGGDIGEYVIHCADGIQRSAPLVFGENIGSWWEILNLATSRNSGPTVAGRGRSVLSDQAGTDMVLFHFRWENPRPVVPIFSITFRSRMTPCAPFLLALTAE